MKPRFFVVHCLKSIAPAQIYKREAYALRKLEKSASYELKAFDDEDEAQSFYQRVEQQAQSTRGAKVLERLKNNLELESTTKERKEEVEEQEDSETSLSQDQKQQRSQWFNRLLEESLVFRKANYAYTKTQKVRSQLQYEGFFDGSTKNNPGESGIGYVIKPADKSRNIISRSAYIGLRTNNVAELIALLMMMGDAYINDIKHFKIFGDSKMIIGFMNGTMEVKAGGLIGYVRAAETLADKFQSVHFSHIGRSYNYQADRLARLAAIKATKNA